MKKPPIPTTIRAYLSGQLRHPKVRWMVLVAVLTMIVGWIAPVVGERINQHHAYQLERELEEERGREQLLLRGSIPAKLSFDVHRGLRLTSFGLSITNTSAVDIVIETRHFFLIRGMEDDGITVHLNEEVAQVRIVDTATGLEMSPHRRLLPKEVIGLRMETSRKASSNDMRTVLEAHHAGRVREDGRGILEVPVLDIPRPSLRMDLDQGEFVVHLGVETSLGYYESIRLGGI